MRPYGRKKKEAPDFPETSYLKFRFVFLQLRQLNSLNLWQHLFQNRTLLNEPARSHLSFLDPIPCLRFLQSVLRLQQFLLCLCHKNPSSLSPLPDDFVPQCVGKLDSLRVA